MESCPELAFLTPARRELSLAQIDMGRAGGAYFNINSTQAKRPVTLGRPFELRFLFNRLLDGEGFQLCIRLQPKATHPQRARQDFEVQMIRKTRNDL